MMRKYRMLACASTLSVFTAVGCADVPDAADEAEVAADVEETAAPVPPTTTAEEQAAPAAQGSQAPATRSRLVAPVRGIAQIAYTKPVVKAVKDRIITTIQVKNMDTRAIAGLKVEEFWYNKAGDAITGSSFRNPKPLLPGDVITVTLETPRDPNMARNQYSFTHANGTVKATLQPTL